MAQLIFRETRGARLRGEIAAARMRLAAVRLQLLLKQNFNPAQPRLAAGSSDGGQWSGGGSGGGYVRVAARSGKDTSEP